MANVLVFAEVRAGDLRKVSLEAVTAGRQLADLSGGGSVHAVLAGDAFFHPAQVACNEWVNSADSDPATAVASRRRIVELVLDRDVVLAGCHFPVPSLGMVRTVDGAARWLPLE